MASLSGKFGDRKPRNPPRCNIRRKKEKTSSSINQVKVFLRQIHILKVINCSKIRWEGKVKES